MHASAEPDDANASADGDGALDHSFLSFLDAEPEERDRLFEERRENDLAAWRYETYDDFRDFRSTLSSSTILETLGATLIGVAANPSYPPDRP